MLFRSYLPRPYKLVLYLIAVAFFCESYGYYIHHILQKQNAWLFNLYMLTEVLLMGGAAIYLVNKKNVRLLFLLLLGINTSIWGYAIFVNSIYSFANFSMVCGCILLASIYLSVFFANSLFKQANIIKQPIFWLCLSTILYFGCDIPYMGLHNYLTKHAPSIAWQLDYINIILDIIRYPLIAISFLLLGRQKNVVLNTA